MQKEYRNFSQKVYEKTREYIKHYIDHPELVTDEVKKEMNALFAEICQFKGVSEHSAWGVKWIVEKRNKATDASPYETVSGNFETHDIAMAVGNVILNGGANMMLKLIAGIQGEDVKPYNNANAKIFVGTDTTAEDASQTGVLAGGGNRASSGMDSGYPQITGGGRTAVFRATFGEDVANFPWQEMSLANGAGIGAIALNRKRADMGTKNGGVWSVQLEVSIVEVA